MKNFKSPRFSAAHAVILATLAGSYGCSSDWPAFRHNVMRTASQLNRSALSDVAQVPRLAVRWTFAAPPGPISSQNGFRASPIVYDNRVFIGSGNGRFYALNADTGALLWQYPPPSEPALRSQYNCNPSSWGLASSASIARIGGVDAVIFGAADPSVGTGLGEGRLFALDAQTGAVIWKSPVVARLTGLTGGSTTEFHEQIGYSSPLIYNNRVYIGVADHCDNPIQKGRVVAVHLATGAVDPSFVYCSAGTCPTYTAAGWSGGDGSRGGGVWSSHAALGRFIYVTTGNTASGGPYEPTPNHGLSMLKLDQSTGRVIWKFQPVPFVLDADPDWAASPTVMGASCGTLLISTQKDGWTHAINDEQPSATARARWSYPPATTPFTGGTHGDTRYMRSGAAWGDVYITMNGGLNLPVSGASGGYKRLHAFNVCAAEADRLRWLIDVPNASGATYSLGHPVVTNGVVYVGTDLGHLVAIADPSLYPSAGWRCSNPDIPTASCVAGGYKLVPQPAVLADVALDGRMVYSEPALSKGRVFVATEQNKVYMLSP